MLGESMGSARRSSPDEIERLYAYTGMAKTLKPPLTFERLREIQHAHRGNPDVMTLLWEIWRMQGLLLRANQIIKSMPPTDRLWPATAGLINTLDKLLDEEPAVKKEMALHEAILKGPRR